MAEEKSASKKSSSAKATEDASSAVKAVEGTASKGASSKPAKAGKSKAGASNDAAAAKTEASAPGDAAPAAAPAPAAAKVETVGGVAKQPSAEDLLKEELGAIKVRKAKGSKNVTSGVANVLASFNNTIVSITDHKGQVVAWSSAGKCNFRGSRKSTAYAAQIVAQDAARNAMSHGLKDIVIRVSGPGLGRDSAIRALQAIGLEITSIVDVTPIPHNGCRPRKRRRV